MKVKVLINYTSPSNFADPIVLLKGDNVQIGETTDPNGEYPNWVFCTCNRTGKTGWVAFGALDINYGVGVALQDYTSKEMSIIEGDILEAIYELNGWFWCSRPSDGETGWVAKNTVECI